MQNVKVEETIAARATAPGRGGVAIVRVSGPLVRSVISSLLKKELLPRVATYGSFLDEKHQILDEGIAIFFPGPHSFTGEDILELHGHGGPVVVDLLLQSILSQGVRLARPGEFSERAFLNGKLDLAQAEAIADLIDASSVQAARGALRSLQGDFSKAIHALNEHIIYLRMYVEAAIDFTDEEIDFLADEKIKSRLEKILTDIDLIQSKAKQGSFLREGINVVIIGKPNVGKSSLLNCLSGKEIAIVTDIAGTTRDVLREHILIDDMPMHVIDTAGLRQSDDIVEQEGIKRAYQEIEKADLILYVCDDDISELTNLPENITTQPIIIVRNKIDLTKETPTITAHTNYSKVSISAKNELGIVLLKQAIKKAVGFKTENEDFYLARRRHLDALSRAKNHLHDALLQLKTYHSGELAAEDLRLAHKALTEITGEFSADDLLGKIFSTFCVGK